MNSHSENRVPLWIDNEPVHTNIEFLVTNSATGKSISASAALPEHVDRVVESSYRAFAQWSRTTIWQRRGLLLKAAKLLEERRREIESILKVEIPIDDFVIQQINIQSSIDLLQELAFHVQDSETGTLLPSKQPNSYAMVIKEPLGVQLGIAPWNASLYLGIRAVATPIACGNTAILKASEVTPLVHNYIGVLFRDAGFPPGVLNIVQHRREDAPGVLDALISDKRVRKINFTGSAAVGKIIAAKAAESCKPVLLELGGKSPQIVLEDADLTKAAEAAATGAFAHHGQICMSTERIIVHASVMEQFSEKLVTAAQKIQVQPGASAEHVAKVKVLVEDSIDRGAKFLFGKGIETENSHMSPRVLTEVTQDMPIWRQETFAPVVTLVPFTTLEEAIDLANDSDYGLSSSIFTSSVIRGIEVARRLDTGAVHINSMTVHDEAHLPHGGTKESGWGRFGVPWGISEFTQLKTITVTDEDLGSCC
ncbi:Aldedh domain-containing protein [Fusarium keratoplasticum]|uniref:Aldedh domain-containing protein n=1 Tax=Fusarium keratoplasticum TaxID=1328300 RepID=A0ACC0RAI2_9HYPO|nr:Aldedh domain-containing protein [Fusarium keratoplasticum]KAI8680417.1 Aldedh domain-containing protein [Fusarium keratoplasticum]